MKRMLSIFLTTIILLNFCACSNDNMDSETSKDAYRIISSYNLVENDKKGMFVVSPESQLGFMDFTSMEQSLLCDNPTCKHSPDGDCTANGKENNPFFYDDKLYYFKLSNLYQEDEKYYVDTSLRSCDMNGANDKEIYKFKKYISESYNRILLAGNMLYICMTRQDYDKGFKELEPSIEMISFNLKTNEMKDYGELIKGYSCGAYLFGCYNGKIIISTSAAKKNKPYMDRIYDYAKENGIDDEKAMSTYVDEYNEQMLEFDLGSEKFEKSNLPECLCVADDIYFYNDGITLKYLDKDGKENTIPDISDVNSIMNAGKYCSVVLNNSQAYLLDTQTLKLVKYPDKYKGQSAVTDFADDIILSKPSYSEPTQYTKVSKSEFGLE